MVLLDEFKELEKMGYINEGLKRQLQKLGSDLETYEREKGKKQKEIDSLDEVINELELALSEARETHNKKLEEVVKISNKFELDKIKSKVEGEYNTIIEMTYKLQKRKELRNKLQGELAEIIEKGSKVTAYADEARSYIRKVKELADVIENLEKERGETCSKFKEEIPTETYHAYIFLRRLIEGMLEKKHEYIDEIGLDFLTKEKRKGKGRKKIYLKPEQVTLTPQNINEFCGKILNYCQGKAGTILGEEVDNVFKEIAEKCKVKEYLPNTLLEWITNLKPLNNSEKLSLCEQYATKESDYKTKIHNIKSRIDIETANIMSMLEKGGYKA
ncbi:MAG: hypothetical protein J7K22_02215 [Nanoarchaeota archaeon]|nr:hypothetical protein [Nanoarchaeota archaeon]